MHRSGKKAVLVALIVFAALILIPLAAQVPFERELFKNTNIFPVRIITSIWAVNGPSSAMDLPGQ